METESMFYDMVLGYQKSHILLTVARLKVADVLQTGPKSALEISSALNTSTSKGKEKEGDYLARILRAAAALGIFHRDPNSLLYSLNPFSKLLLDAPDSCKYLVELVVGTEHAAPWAMLDKTAKDGSVAFDLFHGEEYFEYYSKRPASSEVFNKGMTGNGKLWNLGKVLSEQFPFDKVHPKMLVDVGGGEGSIIKTLLRGFPLLKGDLFDLEHVVVDARNKKSHEDLKDRLTFTGGSFFESITAGADYYMLASVLHDWPDDKAIDILKTTCKAMPPHGKVLVVDRVIKEVGGDVSINLFDIYMMVLVDGKERTENDFQHIFNSASLKVDVIIPLTPTPFSVIVGSKV